MNRIPKKVLNYTGIFLVSALVVSLLLGNSEVCTGIGLLLVAGAMLYLRQQENVSEQDVARRIKAEYPAESQQHVREIYEHMKIKEMEGLFQKILDDSKGGVKKLKSSPAWPKTWDGRHFSIIIGKASLTTRVVPSHDIH